MVDKAERKILDMVEQGQLSAEDGLRLINAMGSDRNMHQDSPTANLKVSGCEVPSPDDILEPSPPRISEQELERMKRLKRWWVLPFSIGLLITTLGAIWMYSGYTASGFGWGFWLSWIPFLLGIFIVGVSFQTSRSVWLHVRIKQKPGVKPQQIKISLPLPVTLSRWFLSVFGNRIPGLREQPLDEYSEILENISPDEPFYVHVNDDLGDEVEVFIG
jgi:hypothetical protein